MAAQARVWRVLVDGVYFASSDKDEIRTLIRMANEDGSSLQILPPDDTKGPTYTYG